MQELLTRPLTERQIRRQMEANGYVEGTVGVDLEEIIDSDREAYMELLSELLTDSTELEEIEYEVVGIDDGMLHIHVRGDATALLEDIAEEEEEDEDDIGYE